MVIVGKLRSRAERHRLLALSDLNLTVDAGHADGRPDGAHVKSTPWISPIRPPFREHSQKAL